MYSLKRITHNQEALIGSSGKSLVVVVYLHNANEETSQLSFSTRKSPCVELLLFPTHLPITLNILFFLRVTKTQGHRTSNHGSTFAFSDALISSTFVDGGGGFGNINCCVDGFVLGAPKIKQR